MKNYNRIALLIDGDNAQSKFIKQYIAEVSKFGKVTVKRVYADWTKNTMNGWKKVLEQNAVRAMQKFAYTNGKNSTDIALIIDAMDLIHSGKIEGVCIVSSDSDFTGIAHRIREEGMFIMGIGNNQTPESFRNACEKFVFTDVFDNENSVKRSKKIIDFTLIDEAFNLVVNENTGLALLSRFSEALRKLDSSFDHRIFGFKNFKDFCDGLKPKYELVLGKDNQTYSIRSLTNNI